MTADEGGRFVLPGEELGTSEEFSAGPGTYEENGTIYAATVGRFEIDRRNFVGAVRAANPTGEIRVGAKVIGVVKDIRESMMEVWIKGTVGSSRSVPGELTGTVHISKMDTSYVDSIGAKYRLIDVVRAKVLQTRPSIQLATNEPGLGVLRALCMRCRDTLVRKGDKLECGRCGRVETRKAAADYGEGAV